MIDFNYSETIDFQALANELKQPKSLIKSIAAYDREMFKRHMLNGVDPYERPYTPLEIRYAQSKRKAVGQKPILERTGKLKRAYKQFMTLDGYRVIIDSEYAKYHQSDLPRTKIPQRLLLPTENKGLPVKFQNKMIELTLKYYELELYKARKSRTTF